MKRIPNLTQFFFSGYFSFFASLASIIGLLLVFITSPYHLIVALLAFILFLVIVLFRVFSITDKFILQKTEQGYHRFATYVRYSTNDGKHITYELFKYIQCKTIIMDVHEHHFHWSGTKPPLVNSDMQEFKTVINTPEGEYNKAILKFKTPLTYNDFSIVHIRMELDDSDKKSKTHVEQRVKEKVQLVSFRIELKHLKKNHDAKIMRRRIDTVLVQEYELIAHVPFNEQTRSYEHNEYNPSINHAYKIDWTK